MGVASDAGGASIVVCPSVRVCETRRCRACGFVVAHAFGRCDLRDTCSVAERVCAARRRRVRVRRCAMRRSASAKVCRLQKACASANRCASAGVVSVVVIFYQIAELRVASGRPVLRLVVSTARLGATSSRATRAHGASARRMSWQRRTGGIWRRGGSIRTLLLPHGGFWIRDDLCASLTVGVRCPR